MQKRFQNSLVHAGRVMHVGDVRTFGSFQVRELVLVTGTAEYPKGLPFEFTKDDINLLDEIQEGDSVEVEYFVEGSADKGTGKFYAHLKARQVVVTAKGNAEAAPGAAPAAAPEAAPCIGCTMQTAIEAWVAKFGDDKVAFGKFCQDARPDIVKAAAAAGQRFTQFAANRLDVWADIKNRIVATQPEPPADDPENLPF